PVSALLAPLQFPETFNPFQFMVNMGLALKGQSARGKDSNVSMVDFNTLPDIYRPPAINLARILVPVAIAVGIGALAYGGLLVQDIGAQTSILHSQINGLNSQMLDLRLQKIALSVDITLQTDAIALMPEQAAQIESQLQSVQATQGALEATLTGLSQGLGKTDADLREAVNLLPAGVTLLGIDFGGDMVTINGIALTEDDIFAYARALRSGGRFAAVIISSINETFREEGGEQIKQFSFDFLLR
ncbi:MAG: PilN domain-containing protein, partial [Dehalococcoidales bacterium]